MKIAFIGQKEIPAKSGGIEKNVREIAVRMAEAGQSVFVYVCSTCAKKMKKSKTYRGVHVVRAPKLINHNFFVSLHVLFGNYDVIHYESKQMIFLTWMAKIFSPSTLMVSLDELQCSLQKNPAFLARRSSQRSTISRWGLREKKYAIFSGQLSKRNGVHYLVEAFKQLEDAAKTPNNFKLVIIGEGSRADDYVKYLHTISEGRDNIIFTGAQAGAAMQQLFSHAYMFVQPSESQGLSLSLLKAMGYGLTPLVSDLRENFEAVRGAGFTFASKSVIDLRDKLAYLLNRPEEVEKIGRLAKQRIRQEFGWDSIVKKTIDVYSKAAAERQ
jgi:glycosyltransferase involved in cell wall biosynthesis